jgi:excisionase family DNA binding protein
MDTMSVQDAARYLGVTEKTIYRYLDKRKLSSEKIGLVHFIPRSEVEAMKVSVHVQTDDQTHLKQRIDTLYELLAAHDFRIKQLEDQLQALRLSERQETPLYSVTSHHKHIREQAATAPREPRPAAISQGNVPADTIPLKDFLHGMSASTVKRNVEMEIGDWRGADGHVIQRVLNPEQQRAFYRWACNRPGFVECPDCPHTV